MRKGSGLEKIWHVVDRVFVPGGSRRAFLRRKCLESSERINAYAHAQMEDRAKIIFYAVIAASVVCHYWK